MVALLSASNGFNVSDRFPPLEIAVSHVKDELIVYPFFFCIIHFRTSS